MCASVVAQTSYLPYTKDFTGTEGKGALPGVSPHILTVYMSVVHSSFLKSKTYSTALGLQRSAFQRIVILKAIDGVKFAMSNQKTLCTLIT